MTACGRAASGSLVEPQKRSLSFTNYFPELAFAALCSADPARGARIPAVGDAMTTRSNRPSAGFRWLKRGISVAFRQPKAILGGAGLLLVSSLPQSLLTLPIQLHAQHAGRPLTPLVMGLMTAISMLIGLLMVPLYAGYLQIIEAVERGLPTRALNIFKPYQQGEGWRLIRFGAAVLLIYVAVIAVIVAAVGSGVVSWYIQTLSAQATHKLPPALPHGFGVAMAFFVMFSFSMTSFYAISLGQMALARRRVFAAMGDGMTGALKNLLPMIVLVLSATVVAIALTVAFVIVAICVALLAKLVSGWLMLLLAVPLYVALMVMMSAVIFGVSYHLWRDVCSDDTVTDTPPPPPLVA